MEFHLGDRVLVRRTYVVDDPWVPALFAYEQKNCAPDEEPYVIFGGAQFDQCIPYEGNEGLVGVVPKPEPQNPEEHKEFDFLQEVEVDVLEDGDWEPARYVEFAEYSDDDYSPHKVLLEASKDLFFVSDECIRAKTDENGAL